MKINWVTVVVLWGLYFIAMFLGQNVEGLVFSTIFAGINIAAIIFTIIWVVQLIVAKSKKDVKKAK